MVPCFHTNGNGRFGAKSLKPATEAQFQVCHWKWQWKKVGECGGVVHTYEVVVVVWWCYIWLCKQGQGVLGQNDQNQATEAQLQVHHWKWLLGEMEGGGMVVCTR